MSASLTPQTNATAFPATVPDDHAHWKSNAGPSAELQVAIGHYLLRPANIADAASTIHDR